MRREAGRLADELGSVLGERPRLRMGGLGVLDVIVDGKVVFSKKAEGRTPSAGELAARVRKA
ncbi:MAG TPA: Rdx family protein [Candidatus Acidoferrum sp.]|nr:Rdx family protein [Candidatus Acidoferrum sp.]